MIANAHDLSNGFSRSNANNPMVYNGSHVNSAMILNGSNFVNDSVTSPSYSSVSGTSFSYSDLQSPEVYGIQDNSIYSGHSSTNIYHHTRPYQCDTLPLRQNGNERYLPSSQELIHQSRSLPSTPRGVDPSTAAFVFPPPNLVPASTLDLQQDNQQLYYISNSGRPSHSVSRDETSKLYSTVKSKPSPLNLQLKDDSKSLYSHFKDPPSPLFSPTLKGGLDRLLCHTLRRSQRKKIKIPVTAVSPHDNVKGLTNPPGDNNCFLNSAVQVSDF